MSDIGSRSETGDEVRDGLEVVSSTQVAPASEGMSKAGIAAMQGKAPEDSPAKTMTPEEAALKSRPSEYLTPSGIAAIQGRPEGSAINFPSEQPKK